MDQWTQNEIQPLNITPEIEYTIGMIKTSAITSMQRFFELQQSTNNDIHAKTDTQLRASKDTMMDDLRALRRGLDRVGSAESQKNHRIHFVKCSLPLCIPLLAVGLRYYLRARPISSIIEQAPWIEETELVENSLIKTAHSASIRNLSSIQSADKLLIQRLLGNYWTATDQFLNITGAGLEPLVKLPSTSNDSLPKSEPETHQSSANMPPRAGLTNSALSLGSRPLPYSMCFPGWLFWSLLPSSVMLALFSIVQLARNELRIRLARTLTRRLNRLYAKVDAGERVAEEDMSVFKEWRWDFVALEK